MGEHKYAGGAGWGCLIVLGVLAYIVPKIKIIGAIVSVIFIAVLFCLIFMIVYQIIEKLLK